MDGNANTELIRNHVDTIILRVLQQQDRYGYEILDIIDDLSEGKYAIKQPTLYSCLKRLEKQGFISSYFGDETHGGRRRYYTLTEKGKSTLRLDQREWEFSRTILDKLLSDKQVDLKTVEAPFDATELRPFTKRVKAYDIPPKSYTAATPIVIPITVEAKTVQMPQEQTKTAQMPNFLSADPTKQENKEEKSSQNEVKAESKSQEAGTVLPPINPNQEQQLAAAKLLQIGEFAPPAKVLIEQQISSKSAIQKSEQQEETRPSLSESKHDTYETDKSYSYEQHYKDTLGAFFSKQTPHLVTDNAGTPPPLSIEIPKTDESQMRSRQFYDLKQSLEAEGYKLKSYSKANAASQYYMNYVFGNRIIRDTSFLLYLTVIIELIIIYIGRKVFGYGLDVLIPIGAVALVLPVIGGIIWAFHPNKRIKARFSFQTALINSIIAYILIVALATIIYLVSPSIDIGFADGRMYIPYILAANAPLYVLLYNFLYQSKHYHIK